MPFLHVASAMEGSPLAEYVRKIDRRKRRTNDFLVELNQPAAAATSVIPIRMEPGVQTCDETLQEAQRLVPRLGLAAGAHLAASGTRLAVRLGLPDSTQSPM